ncbi:MAG: signal peptidase I [Clostridiales bacterium]|nr:signal peptidase I [Clostridiales bacterium]
MNENFKRIWNWFTGILVAIVGILAVLFVGVRLFGFQVYSVLSGSMEPNYPVGSLLYVKEVDPFELKVNDVITYAIDEETVVTHRIVGIVPDENDPEIIRFRTKGDANTTEDGMLVWNKNVQGTPVFTIPVLGYVANFIQHPPGTYISIAIGAVLLILVFLPDIFEDDSKEEKKKKSAKAKGKVRKASAARAEAQPRHREVRRELPAQEAAPMVEEESAPVPVQASAPQEAGSVYGSRRAQRNEREAASRRGRR